MKNDAINTLNYMDVESDCKQWWMVTRADA